jgi:hypothetical protein
MMIAAQRQMQPSSPLPILLSATNSSCTNDNQTIGRFMQMKNAKDRADDKMRPYRDLWRPLPPAAIRRF